MTIHTFEGIMIVAVIYALGIGLGVFYILWRGVVAKLKDYQDSEEDERKAIMSKPRPDIVPIICGHTDPSANACDERSPIKNPPTTAKATLYKVRFLVRKRVSRLKDYVNQIREES